MATPGSETNSNRPPLTPETKKVKIPKSLATSVVDKFELEIIVLPPCATVKLLLISAGASSTATPVMFFTPAMVVAPSSTLVAIVKSAL